jgi:hypothetical protein
MDSASLNTAPREQGLEPKMNATIKTYFATHNLGRASTCTADADAIIQRVNSVTASNGDSLYKDRVQDEIDALADAETQALFGITVEFSEVEIDE